MGISRLKAQIIQPEDIAYIWEEVAPLLNTVREHTEGELETDDFLEPLTHGDMQLWIATEGSTVHGVMVTQLIPYPQKKILRVISLAGDNFEELREFQEMIEAFAVKTGCTALEMWGRKGWKKLLPDWEDTYVVYTKDLKHRMQ
tara:strand:+ start:801 stop:1232 length:432 start_codon:yes stop_codon:yes gene_type:complete